MKETLIKTRITVYPVIELPEKYKLLYDSASNAAMDAYAPYSGFQVGAAVLLDDGTIVCGNNQENAAYPSGLCAERVALFYAGAQYPDIPVKAIAIAAFSEGQQVAHVSPCGSCRQVLLETENRFRKPIRVILCGTEEVGIIESAASLLPVGFDGCDLVLSTGK